MLEWHRDQEFRGETVLCQWSTQGERMSSLRWRKPDICGSVLSSLISFLPTLPGCWIIRKKTKILWAQFSFSIILPSQWIWTLHFEKILSCYRKDSFPFCYQVLSTHIPLKICLKISLCYGFDSSKPKPLPAADYFHFCLCIHTNGREAINTLNDGVYIDQFFVSPFHCAVDIKVFW